jgi:HrpA-like RNA helicase
MMNVENLPIIAYKGQILDAVANNQVVIITAETGAGKSTQVPQFFLEAGYDIVVTQPRRLAARTVAERVAEEIGEELGLTVGYQTGGEGNACVSDATRCLFCTDGLAMIRELMGKGKGDILVLDEVHEWNENMEVLVAWAKQALANGAKFKLVLMSATLESAELSKFYNDAPVIEVPGRLFPVTEETASRSIEDDVAELVRQGRNVLVFQPGKAEIDATIAELVRLGVQAKILPLHGNLTNAEQKLCFAHYSQPKVVVSTNVAQTSVTIGDIDAVVDSGMERRIEMVSGVEGLYLRPISLADAKQRKGRAGRTKPGIYIDHCATAERIDFPLAEIMRKRLDQMVLRLAIAGFNMEELQFFHQPKKEEIHRAHESLISLGCMTKEGQVTKIGRTVNRMPVSVQFARMMIEADRLGVVDDILIIAAILEQDGITAPPPSKNRPDRPDWRHMIPDERVKGESDVLAQLAVWRLAEHMTKTQMKDRGIALRDYDRAKELHRQLISVAERYFTLGSTGNRTDILKAVCAGMVDHLYRSNRYGGYQNGDGIDREIGNSSVVRHCRWMVGKPFDLELEDKRRGSKFTLYLVELASMVELAWLVEVAPQLVTVETGIDPFYDASADLVFSTSRTSFKDHVLGEQVVADGEHPEAANLFAAWLVEQTLVA